MRKIIDVLNQYPDYVFEHFVNYSTYEKLVDINKMSDYFSLNGDKKNILKRGIQNCISRESWRKK